MLINMKKLALIFCLLSVGATHAQHFNKGDHFITGGLGFSPWSRGFLTAGFVGGYEYGLTEKLGVGRIGIGGNIGLFYENRYANTVVTNTLSPNNGFRFSFALRGAYHFDLSIDKTDIYAGLTGVVHAGSASAFFPEPGIFAGIRYYFKNNLGVYGEIGYGITNFHGGLVYSL
jgi:hypothetical protein